MDSELLTRTNMPDNFWDTNPQCSDSSQPSLSPKCSHHKDKFKKPKRNKSAFILFSSETRAKFKADSQLCMMNSNETMVKLAELWRDLTNEEKEKYNAQAEKDKVRYLEELNTFCENCPMAVIKNKTKKNHIKKPCSSYAIFVKEMKDTVKSEHPELKMADILKVISERWKSLNPEEKEVYQEKSRIDKELVKAKLDENLKKEQLKESHDLDTTDELGEPIIKKKVKRCNEASNSKRKNKANKGDSQDPVLGPTRSASDADSSLKTDSKLQESLDLDFPELDFQNCGLNLSNSFLTQMENEMKQIVNLSNKVTKKPSESILDCISFESGASYTGSLGLFDKDSFRFLSNSQFTKGEKQPLYLTCLNSKPSRIDIFNNTITQALKMRAENDFFKQDQALETNFSDFQL